MSDPKRATIITVGAPKSEKNNVTKTVRLTISLDESNERKYPELNYKELVNAEEKKKTPTKVLNGKSPGLDPFSDNDDDVERVAKKFEQKYGGKSTYYGRKGRPKHDEFADIGAGYDENDSFIDNTDGYDEMIPPECDTLYGGFYINSGSLEFKTVPGEERDDGDVGGHRRNKRRISSSSSEDSSESSSESSRDVKEKPVPNGDVAEHRKKKIKKLDKKAKRIRRNDSSAANSGKLTSDDNLHADGESADSRTSHSDSLTSKPAPSSENAGTSDSSRDTSEKPDPLPVAVQRAVDDLKSQVAKWQLANPRITSREINAGVDPYLVSIKKSLSGCDPRVQKSAWGVVARLLDAPRAALPMRATALIAAENNHKRMNCDGLGPEEKEALVVDTLNKLKSLIEEKTPAMMANYKAECERVQEERRKLQASATEGAPHVEKRMPKRRFPWCALSRSLLASLASLGGADLLASRALPLFPAGFARRPTLLRQADLKPDDVKRQRANSTVTHALVQPMPVAAIPPPAPKNPTTKSQPQSQPPHKPQSQPKTTALPHPQPKTTAPSQPQPKTSSNQPPPKVPTPTFTEPIQFPSSLTVTTTLKTTDKSETIVLTNDDKKESLKIPNSITIMKEDEKRKEERSDKYIPPNSIGSITITPVTNQKKVEKEGLIRVKTPAVLMKEANDIAKKDKDRNKQKEKRISPLTVETNFHSKDKICPTNSEDKIPRPGLIPVNLSPTFAKPDKRPPDAKRKKDILIVSDMDPLSDGGEPVAVDDSSSDVEVVEEKEKEDPKTSEERAGEKMDVDEPDTDIDAVMRNLREMQDSQEPNYSNSSFGSVIKSDRNTVNKMDGCNAVTS